MKIFYILILFYIHFLSANSSITLLEKISSPHEYQTTSHEVSSLLNNLQSRGVNFIISKGDFHKQKSHFMVDAFLEVEGENHLFFHGEVTLLLDDQNNKTYIISSHNTSDKIISKIINTLVYQDSRFGYMNKKRELEREKPFWELTTYPGNLTAIFLYDEDLYKEHLRVGRDFALLMYYKINYSLTIFNTNSLRIIKRSAINETLNILVEVNAFSDKPIQLEYVFNKGSIERIYILGKTKKILWQKKISTKEKDNKKK